MGVAPEDRSGGGLDQVGQVRVGVALPQRRDQRRREDDVADETEAEEENTQLRRIYFSIVASSMSITGMSSLIG